MGILRAAILGLIQGITEFVPLSSSGHLVIIPRVLGWHDPGLAFDVVLHTGTLIALLVFFIDDWIRVVRGFFSSFKKRRAEWGMEERLAWLIIFATIPAILAGAAFEGFFSDNLRSPRAVALLLALTGFVLLFSEFAGKRLRGFEELTLRDAITIGFAQVFSLAPGISRSGITISAGMLRGLDREGAARFSFLMAAPIIAGASVYEGVKIFIKGVPKVGMLPVAVGFLSSALTGFVAIKLLMRYLRRHSLLPFGIYCLTMATFTILFFTLA